MSEELFGNHSGYQLARFSFLAILEARMPEENKQPSIGITVRFVICGCVLGLALGVLCIILSGGGYGGFTVPMVLAFPYLFIVAAGGGPIAVFVMFGQYPLYGWILGEAIRRGRFERVRFWLLGVHAIAIVLVATGVAGPWSAA